MPRPPRGSTPPRRVASTVPAASLLGKGRGPSSSSRAPSAPAPVAFFLRGVNVGGARTMKPTEFAAQLKDHEVVSIGAAGTFVARKPGPHRILEAAVQNALPHPTEVVFLSSDQLAALLRRRGPKWDLPPRGTRRFVTLLAQEPNLRPGLPIYAPRPSGWVLQVVERVDRAVLSLRRADDAPGMHYPNPVVEAAFGVPATTRGWETLLTVAERAGVPV